MREREGCGNNGEVRRKVITLEDEDGERERGKEVIMVKSWGEGGL